MNVELNGSQPTWAPDLILYITPPLVREHIKIANPFDKLTVYRMDVDMYDSGTVATKYTKIQDRTVE